MNQSDVEKYINTRYTKNKYRNSWKEYKSIQIVIKTKCRQCNKLITRKHRERNVNDSEKMLKEHHKVTYND
jgi:hypothetical protein